MPAPWPPSSCRTPEDGKKLKVATTSVPASKSLLGLRMCRATSSRPSTAALYPRSSGAETTLNGHDRIGGTEHDCLAPCGNGLPTVSRIQAAASAVAMDVLCSLAERPSKQLLHAEWTSPASLTSRTAGTRRRKCRRTRCLGSTTRIWTRTARMIITGRTWPASPPTCANGADCPDGADGRSSPARPASALSTGFYAHRRVGRLSAGKSTFMVEMTGWRRYSGAPPQKPLDS